MRWRRRLLPAAAVLAVPLAVVLVLLAVDVLQVNAAVEDDDVRFQARPTLPSGLWEQEGFLPAGVARSVVGVDDDLRYRRAAWLFARVQPGRLTTTTGSPEQDALHAGAETKLIDASRAEPDPHRRSRLLNMLGLLALDRYAQDPADRINIVRSAVDSFQSAIKADPSNSDAKFNLELVLRDFETAEAAGTSPDRGANRGRQAGLGRDGSGY
jgi:hypothetical protein